MSSPFGKTREKQTLICAISAADGYAVPCTMPMCSSVSNVRRGKTNPITARHAEKKFRCRTYIVPSADVNCNMERLMINDSGKV